MPASQRAIPWIGAAAITVAMLVSTRWLLLVWSLLFMGIPTRLVEAFWYSLPDRRSRTLHSILMTFAMILGALVPGALYWVLARKAARRPERAKRVLLASAAVLAALSAWWYAVSWDYGLRYQGIGFIYLNLALGAAAVIGMGVIAVCWRSRPSPVLPMLFLWIEFVWALGCAFPWLGETF